MMRSNIPYSDCAPRAISPMKQTKARRYTTFPARFQLSHSGGKFMKAFN